MSKTDFLQYMAANSSQIDLQSSMYMIKVQVISVQVLVSLFLCINSMLLATFFMKESFYTTMRYMLFAVTLFSDSMCLLLSNILLIFNYLNFTTQVWKCTLIIFALQVYTLATPATLTTMTLERYVAICMPLRHAQLCTMHSSLRCILIIHALSSLPCIVFLSIILASATHNFYTLVEICAMELFIVQTWQNELKFAISQFYFLIMCIIIVFSYVKIMTVAKAVSGENRKATWKGLRTVIFHAFQLLLCLIQLWCPIIEAFLLQIDLKLYIHVRFVNYITFILVPRCLSPLIYGLRDNNFFHALKYYTLRGLCIKKKKNLF